MNKLYLFCSIVLMSLMSYGQSPEKGRKILNISAGNAFDASFEWMLTNSLSAGPFISFYTGRELVDNRSKSMNYRTLGGNVSYHFIRDNNFNLYTNVRLGSEKRTYKNDSNGTLSYVRTAAYAGIGARYFITDQLALAANAGVGYVNLLAGLSYRF